MPRPSVKPSQRGQHRTGQVEADKYVYIYLASHFAPGPLFKSGPSCVSPVDLMVWNVGLGYFYLRPGPQVAVAWTFVPRLFADVVGDD